MAIAKFIAAIATALARSFQNSRIARSALSAAEAAGWTVNAVMAKGKLPVTLIVIAAVACLIWIFNQV